MEAPIKPIDSLLEHIATAVEEWKQQNTPETIKQSVKEKLDKEGEAIMLHLLGFRHGFGRWELDNTNGKTNAAGEYLRATQAEAIKEWLSSFEIPTPSPAVMKELRKSVAETYRWALQSSLRDLAQRQAHKDAEALVQGVVASDQIENFLKLTKLINPEPQQET